MLNTSYNTVSVLVFSAADRHTTEAGRRSRQSAADGHRPASRVSDRPASGAGDRPASGAGDGQTQQQQEKEEASPPAEEAERRHSPAGASGPVVTSGSSSSGQSSACTHSLTAGQSVCLTAVWSGYIRHTARFTPDTYTDIRTPHTKYRTYPAHNS